MTTRVVFVVGKGRSGSTLLDTLLGQIPGVFSMGELRFLWSWGVIGGYQCGCGTRIPECPIWSQVIVRVRERVPEAQDPQWAARVTDRVLRWPAVPAALLAARGGAQPRAMRDFLRLYEHTYAAVREVSGCAVLVDSSKWPTHPMLLGLSKALQPTAVLLVRDPRGVAASYRRGKSTGGAQPEMPRFGALHTSASWSIRNLAAEILPRASTVAPVRLRYEDLIAAPNESLRTVLGPAGMNDVDLDFLEGHRAEIDPTHTVGGNPGRFETGGLALQLDERWRQDLPDSSRRLIEVTTYPLMRRYGYLSRA